MTRTPAGDDATLFLGDCLDVMRSIPDGSVDLVCADLPYGTTACRWDAVIPLEPLWAHYRRVLKPKGAVVLTAYQPFTTALITSNPKWFRYSMVWEKGRSTGFLDANRRPLRAHEDVLVFAEGYTTYHPQMVAGAPYKTRNSALAIETLRERRASALNWETVNHGTRHPTSVLRFPNPNGKGKVHPTQKPVALMEWLIRTYSHPGETVLDNAMGSGTTGVACLNSGRCFIGIERDPAYHAIAARRLADARAARTPPACA